MIDKKNKLAFLSMPAPASYVAGLGRGASGFTTRSDIGPAREGPSAEVVAEAQARRGEEPDYDPEQYQDPDNEVGLFSGTAYDEDDAEADKIYDGVDEQMDLRRKAKREAREREELTKYRAERPKIQAQFSDLKRGLSDVTDEEWENLPEVGNLTRKKRKKDERSFAVPDSVLAGDRERNQYENSLDPDQQEFGGFETPAATGSISNLVEIGQARDRVLSLKLDQLSGSASTSGFSTSVDPKGYLTDLNSVIHKSEAEIGDIKRARMLYESLIKSNPKHAPGWIAAANLEEHAGRMVAARKLIKQGCENCPKNEDVWLEAARLHKADDAKVILAEAVQHVGQSVKIWIAAAELEGGDIKSKKRVYRKALEAIPNSVTLWKRTVNLETSPEDARILLARAVEVIPLSVELWLTLARLETPDRSKAVLNKARKAIPTSHEIWIAAGRLTEEEAQAEGLSEDERKKLLESIDKRIEAAVRELRRHQVSLNRDQWLKEAERCETEGSPRTCEAIIKATIGFEIEEQDRFDTWLGDAESAESRGYKATARAILAYTLRAYPDRIEAWRQAAELEKRVGTQEAYLSVLARAVHHCPQAEDLWLRAAKEKWVTGNVPEAREILEQAFVANPESEPIWLAAVKLEAESGETEVARQLLVRARTVAGTARIWMKSAVFERQQGSIDSALSIVSEALKKFPKFPKFYMIQGQIFERQKNIAGARASYAAGVKACPKEVTLWILASRLEESDGKGIKARSLLEKARLVNPANEELWTEAVGVEERAGASGQAKTLMARGLQECPTSGSLWSLAIWAEPRPQRKARSVDALKKTVDNPILICTVARLFWAESKIEKAREWFIRSVKPVIKNVEVVSLTASERPVIDGSLIGDSWGWFLKFEEQHGTAEHRERVIAGCTAAEPKYGRVWQPIAKDDKNAGKPIRELLQLTAKALQ